MAEYATTWQKWLRGGIVGLIGAGLALGVWWGNLLEFWEAKTWDLRVAYLARPGPATDDIRLILVDQSSLEWGEEVLGLSWPWHRQILGIITDFCRASGVKALGFDLVLSEPSVYGVADDVEFGKALAAFPAIAGTISLGQAMRQADTAWPNDAPLPGVAIAGLDAWLTTAADTEALTASQAALPIPEILNHAAVLGNTHQIPDYDGVYRRVSPFTVFDKAAFPALGFALYHAAHPNSAWRIESGTLLIGETAVPLDRQGRTVLRYRGPTGTYRAYSAAAILQPEMKRLQGDPLSAQEQTMIDDFRGKYVLFGASAAGLFDQRPAPVGGVFLGVEIQATMLDNLLSNDFLRPAPAWVTVALALALAFMCAMTASFFSNPLADLGIGAVMLAVPPGLALWAYTQGFWLPLVVQEITAALTIVLMLAANYATEGRQKRFIKNAFKHYLSPAVIDQLLQHPEQLKLGGEKKAITIFFSDLQGFTSISEGLTPEALTALLNEYLSAMTDIIQEEQGTIDKYEGDAIIAFWNAPLNVDDHAIHAVRAALRCQAKLAEMRPAVRQRIGKEMYMRIGLNTGPAVVGNMGSRSRFDYTMFGDAVNLAARLEGVNKQFGTYTMLSQNTRDQLDDTFAFRELARVAVVGKKEPVTVYEPMLPEEYEARKDVLTTFAQALQLFYQGDFSRAREMFLTIQDRDPAAAAYARKCVDWLTVPPERWNGVWVMTTK